MLPLFDMGFSGYSGCQYRNADVAVEVALAVLGVVLQLFVFEVFFVYSGPAFRGLFAFFRVP